MIILFVAIIFPLIDAISLNSSSSKKEKQSVVCLAVMMMNLMAMIWILIQMIVHQMKEKEFSSASQTVCMSGTANVDLLHEPKLYRSHKPCYSCALQYSNEVLTTCIN